MPIKNQVWRLRKKVLPQHTDHAGVMWHGSYINWLEEARIEALSEVGLSYKEISKAGFEIPVLSLNIHYRKSLNHGEEVTLESTCLPREGVRWPWFTKIFKDDQSLVLEAEVILVVVTTKGGNYRPIRHLPQEIETAFLRL